jgi:hypothetical protein
MVATSAERGIPTNITLGEVEQRASAEEAALALDGQDRKVRTCRIHQEDGTQPGGVSVRALGHPVPPRCDCELP